MPPNIVLLVLDTLRRDHCSIHGYERDTTPFLDSFGEENSYSGNAYANSCWSVPSHASLMTGRYPFEHGVTAEDTYMDADGYLPAKLRDNGYTTLGFSNNPWISGAFGWDRGFDRFVDHGLPDDLSRLIPLTLTSFSKLGLTGYWALKNPRDALGSLGDMARFLPRSLGISDGGAKRTNRDVVAELDDTEQPFFLFINYMDIHEPHRSGLLHHPFSGLRQRFTGNRNYRDRFQPRFDIEDTVALYDDSVSYLDRKVGELLEAMEARGLMEDTVVVVTSDHGQLFSGEHLGHAPVMDREVLEVPFFSKGLDVPGEPFTLRDAYWKVLDAADVPHSEDAPGPVLAEVYGSLRENLPDYRSPEWWKRYEAVLLHDDRFVSVSSIEDTGEHRSLFPPEVIENAESGVEQERFEIDF